MISPYECMRLVGSIKRSKVAFLVQFNSVTGIGISFSFIMKSHPSLHCSIYFEGRNMNFAVVACPKRMLICECFEVAVDVYRQIPMW